MSIEALERPTITPEECGSELMTGLETSLGTVGMTDIVDEAPFDLPQEAADALAVDGEAGFQSN